MSDRKDPADFSFLDLPDDEVENHRPGAEAPVVVTPAAEEGTPDADDAADGNDAGAAGEGSQEAAAEVVPAKVEAEVVVEDKAPAKPAAPAVAKPAGEADPAKVEAKPAEAAKAEADAVDYKAEYSRMLAPFKANGKEVAVNSVDDAIALMQMGANYNKKMAALKPNLMLLKLLESNGLLSEEKISYLIDLTKKDPGAINKLVKDSGLDPLELDADKAAGYKPTVRKIDEREVELDAVLDEIQTTPSYQRTIEIVSKEWDGPSKQVIADSPGLLRLINQHVQAGIYDLINTEVERERMFGRLQGLSDLQAYKQVGDAVQARGGFDHLGQAPQGQPNTPKPAVVVPNTLKEEEERLKDKKRAASSPKPAAATTTPKDFNPLSMSDAEFSKLAQSRYA
jgi:hypothetical protein